MPQRQAGGGGQQVGQGQGQGQVQGQQFIHPSASAAAAAAAHYYRLPAGSGGGGSISSSSSAGGAGAGSNALASQQQQQQRLSPPSLTAPSPPLYSSSSHQNHHHPPQHHSHHPYHPQHPQHHQHHHHHPPPTPSSSSSPSSSSNPSQIIDVYADTLESELVAIRDAIEIYPFVAFDTEFPGVVARPIGHFKSTSDYHYQTLRSNVDLLRIIQLGVTLSDENGNLAEPVSTWQFNFKFSLDEDMYAPESIDLLTNSGINFKKHQEYGIDVESFGELLISSGLVLFDDVKWISFHSGYDFGYLLKLVSCAPLPPTEAEFFELLKIWFPCIYDIKFLMRSCKSLKGGLQDVADELQVPRIGPQHQAGSDSLLTSATFFKMRSRYFEDDIDPKYLGNLYGLGSSSTLFHQTSSSGSGSGSVPGGISSTPQLQSALPTPGGMSALVGPPIPPVASAALPIKDPFGASPFKLQQGGSMVSTPGGTLADLPHASSPSPGSGLRGL